MKKRIHKDPALRWLEHRTRAGRKVSVPGPDAPAGGAGRIKWLLNLYTHQGAAWLDWLLNLCAHQAELNTCKPEQVNAIVAEIGHFVMPMSGKAGGTKTTRPNITREQLQSFIVKIATKITDFKERQGWNIPPVPIGRFVRIGGRFHYTSDDLLVAAEWRAQELANEHRDQLRRCRRKACNALFVRTRRGEYCSKSCSQVERTAKWRAGDPERARKRRHARYVTQLKTRNPAAAKLAKRRPKARWDAEEGAE